MYKFTLYILDKKRLAVGPLKRFSRWHIFKKIFVLQKKVFICPILDDLRDIRLVSSSGWFTFNLSECLSLRNRWSYNTHYYESSRRGRQSNFVAESETHANFCIFPANLPLYRHRGTGRCRRRRFGRGFRRPAGGARRPPRPESTVCGGGRTLARRK